METGNKGRRVICLMACIASCAMLVFSGLNLLLSSGTENLHDFLEKNESVVTEEYETESREEPYSYFRGESSLMDDRFVIWDETVPSEEVISQNEEVKLSLDEPLRLDDYEVREPIQIDNDEDFAAQAVSEGWPGDGTEGDPYIIEGYEIDGAGHGYCIYIGNTTVYFLLRENYLHSASGVSSDYFVNSGINLYNVQNGMVVNNTASNNDRSGIFLWGSNNNTLQNNTANLNSGSSGIYLGISSNNTISHNSLSDNSYGILVYYYSDNNVIVNNTMSDNHAGIYLSWGSKKNLIASNYVSYNLDGIRLYDTTKNTLTDNILINNGILIFGNDLSYWNTHIMDPSNTINGKPVYYRKDRTGGTVPAGAGQVILANCTGVIVDDQNVGKGTAGVQLGFSDDNIITNNIANSNNRYGISLYRSHQNYVVDNTINFNDWDGLVLVFSHGNELSVNNAINNGRYGFSLSRSDNSSISNNIVSSNHHGVFLYSSYNNIITDNNISYNGERGVSIKDADHNLIYHNSFIDNGDQAYDEGDNDWDHGNPAEGGKGGNYWDDYVGNDRGDGIGDVPYDIPGSDNQDRYPWVNPEMVHLVGDFAVFVEDIHVGSSPVISILEAYDVHGNLISGVYRVQIEINRSITTELTFSQGESTYIWDEMTVADRYDVEVTIDEVTGFDTFHVKPGTVSDILISPMDSTIIAGNMQVYTVIGYDDWGNEFDMTEETVFSICENAGGIWAENIYTSEFSGRWAVIGECEGITKEATLTVKPASVHTVTIYPDAHRSATAGVDLSFSAEARDVYGNLITDAVTNFTWQNATNGVFNKVTIGEYQVTAAYEGVTSVSTTVTVEPASASYVIITPTESTITAGQMEVYNAIAYDGFGNEIGDVTNLTNWSIGTDAGGSWSDNVYRSEKAGTWIVTGDYNGLTESATLTIEVGHAASVIISPSEQQTVTAGEELVFTATAYDEHGNLITETVTDFSWKSATNGVFYQSVIGTYDVTATYKGVTSSSTTVVVLEDDEVERETFFTSNYEWLILLSFITIVVISFLSGVRYGKRDRKVEDNGSKQVVVSPAKDASDEVIDEPPKEDL